MIKIPINIDRPRNKNYKKADPKNYYIYKTKLMVAAIFYKTAGGVGRAILDYLLWQRSMIGIQETTIPNKFFEKHYGIKKQRKAEALKKLAAADLITLSGGNGKAFVVKLNIRDV